MKKNEGFFHQNSSDERKRIKQSYKIHNLVRTADLKKTFSKGDTTNCSYELYKISKGVKGTMPSYCINDLPERYNEVLLRKKKITLKENKKVMKKLNIII